MGSSGEGARGSRGILVLKAKMFWQMNIYFIAGREEQEEYVPTSVDPVNYPPGANALGQRWFFARDYPDLADGIYTCVALRSRGLNPNVLAATGLLQGWKTEPPVLRKGQSTGVQSTTIYWW